MDKPPAFQFYVKDFLADLNVIMMTTEDVGAYVFLMCVCWNEGELPNDMEALAGVTKLPLEKFTDRWEKRLRTAFTFDEKRNCFVHPRLQKELQKQKAFRKKKSDAGKESGRKRRENKELSPERVFDSVQTKDEQTRTLHTASSSASADKETTTNVVVKKATTPATKMTDSEWLESLKNNPVFAHVNVGAEFEKATLWGSVNNRTCTRRFFVNWLNRIQPPIQTEANQNGTNNGTATKYPDRREIEAKRTRDAIAREEELFRIGTEKRLAASGRTLQSGDNADSTQSL